MKHFLLRWITIVSLFFLSSTPLLAQPDSLPAADSTAERLDQPIEPEPPTQTDAYSLANPRETISRHLHYLGAGNDPAKAADALYPGDLSLEERIRLARLLKQIYDARGDWVKPELIPDNPNYVDSLSQQARFVVFPDKYPGLYVQKYGNTWLYSRASVGSIERVHNEVIPAAAHLLMRIPGGSFLGLQVWQYAGLLAVIGLSFLVYLILKYFFGFLIRRVVPRIAPQSALDPALIPPVTTPLSLLLVVVLLREELIPSLLLPIGLSGWIVMILKILAPIFGVLVFYRLVDILAGLSSTLASKTETTMDDQLIPLLSKTAKLVIAVFGIIFVLQNLDVNVTALLAGVSIGGLALALAAQDTVKNFISSISIFVDRPFVVGDFIDTGSFMGVVTEVGVRSTRIRALDGAQITIPNGRLIDMTITNHGVRTYRRYATNLAITYSTPPAVIERFVDGVRQIASTHPMVQPDSVVVQFHEMADSSLNLFFAAIYETTDHATWLRGRQEVFLQIMHLAQELGVSFAFPSTSVYLESMPEAKTS